MSLNDSLHSAEALAEHDLITAADVAAIGEVAARYSVSLTPLVAREARRHGPESAIARQFVPRAGELTTREGELADPIGDEAHSPVRGIVHRYPDRVLLKLLTVCPVYCRFCFRRESVGAASGAVLSADEVDAALDYIERTPQIWEVILSGGDPLALSPRRLRSVLARLGAMPHVRVLRVHTRVPFVDPERVNDQLLAALSEFPRVAYIAVHVNHADEFTTEAVAALARLRRRGLILLGQSVLLRGVNDSAEALSALFRRCVEEGVKPYYLHHADLAPGTSHFRTSLSEGQALMRELRGKTSGVCLPQYVLDIPGGFGKVPVGPQYLAALESEGEGERWRVSDPSGEAHIYPPPCRK